MCNCKGNPVPSLENIIGELYRDHYEMYRRGAYDFPSEDDFVKEQVALYKLNNPQYFQNGVETNKEQLLKDWYENKPII